MHERTWNPPSRRFSTSKPPRERPRQALMADAPGAAVVLHGLDVRRDLCDLLHVRAWLRDGHPLFPRMLADGTEFFRPGHDGDARAERTLCRFYGPPRSFLSDRGAFDVVIVIAEIVDIDRLAARHAGLNGAHAANVQRELWRHRLLQTRATVIATAERGASSVTFGYLGPLPGYREPFAIRQATGSEVAVVVHERIPVEAITIPPRPVGTPRATSRNIWRA